MPFPWSKSSSRDAKKKQSSDNSKPGGEVLPRLQHLGKKGHRWLTSEDESGNNGSSRGGSRSSFDSPRLGSSETTTASFSPSAVGTRTPSFAENAFKAQPLPLPTSVTKLNGSGGHHLVLPTYEQVEFFGKHEGVELDGTTSGYGSCSMSSGSSLSSGEAPDNSWLGNPARGPVDHHHNSSNSNGHAIANSSLLQRRRGGGESYVTRYEAAGAAVQKAAGGVQQGGSVSPLRARAPVKPERPSMHMNVPARSAPTSLLSSPSHSPRRLSASEQQALFQKMLPEYNSSASNSTNRGGRISPEKSPLASPRRSPGPGSRIPSAGVSPLHTTRGMDSPSVGHRLPPPPPGATGTTGAGATFSSSSGNSAFPSSPIGSPSGLASLKWQKGNLLGCGSFGRVYKGFSCSGTFCAMKEVLVVDDPKSKECVKQLMQEINMLSSLRHPNIVQYLGSEMIDDGLYIYLEFVSGGSIQKVLQEYGAFKEPVIRSYTHQILLGLSYLHSMNKVHRDIKGANILVDTNGEVKLADFGMAKHISSNSLVLSFKGSPYWMAPEVFKSTTQSYPVDIWSLGCTIIEMASGKPPWSQYEGVAAMFKIGNSKEIPYIPESLSPVAQDFIRLCLQRNSEDRPTAHQLLEHPFVKFSHDEQQPDSLPPASPTFRSVVANLSVDYNPKAPYSARDQSSHRPVSPIGSPSVHTRSVYSTYGGLTPVITSGASTPRPCGYEDVSGSPRVQGFSKERVTMGSRVNGMHIDAVRSEQGRYGLGVSATGNRSPRAQHRSEFVWNPPAADASQRRPLATEILGVALLENSRFYDNRPAAERRHHSPLRSTDRFQ